MRRADIPPAERAEVYRLIFFAWADGGINWDDEKAMRRYAREMGCQWKRFAKTLEHYKRLCEDPSSRLPRTLLQSFIPVFFPHLTAKKLLRGNWRIIRLFVLNRDKWRCRYCGGAANSVDHIFPRSRGGDNLLENLAAACRRCNSSKGDKSLHEAGMELLPIPDWTNVRNGSERSDQALSRTAA